MATLAEKNSSITVLKIDIHDAGSPVARQYRIEKIPYFEIYDEEGTLIAKDEKAVTAIGAGAGVVAAGFGADPMTVALTAAGIGGGLMAATAFLD